MSAQTNDKNIPKIILNLYGKVKPKSYVSEDIVRLTGSVGQDISKTLTITPSSENPFKITGIKTVKGEYITCQLDPAEQNSGREYQLKVHNTKTEKGYYIDKILIQTDSQTTPEFIVRVFGFIRE